MTELLDFSAGQLFAAATILFLASLVRGYSGFGFSAVLVAGLAFFINPIEAVVLAIGLEVLASVVQGPGVWHDIEWRRLGVLVVAAVVGNPVGVLLATSIEADTLATATFVTLAVLTIAVLADRTPLVGATPVAFFVVGVIAGVVNGSTAMSGLVLVLAMSAMRVSPTQLRGTLVAYFFFSDIYALSLFLWRGELDSVYAWRLAISVPLMIIGVLIGSKAFLGTSVETFRKATLTLLLIISAVGLIRLGFG